MALQTSYLAAENSGMERRARALHRFLVASPIALLVAVGLVAHLRKPPYPQPAGSAAYDRQVMAYQGRVAGVEKLREIRDTATGAQVEAEAKAWIEGYRSGELVAVPPAFYEDHMRDGVRGEIVRAGVALSSDLALRAERAFENGETEQAVEQALLASETAYGFRNFELQSYLQSLLIVRRGLGIALRAWPSLPEATRAALRPRVVALRADAAEVDQLVETGRVQLQDYMRRQKLASLKEAPGNLRLDDGPDVQEAAAAKRSVGLCNARVASFVGKP